jgi:hypothetical protein
MVPTIFIENTPDKIQFFKPMVGKQGIFINDNLINLGGGTIVNNDKSIIEMYKPIDIQNLED